MSASTVQTILGAGIHVRQALAFVTGVLIHIFLFRRGEWDLATIKILSTFCGGQLIAAYGLVHFVPAYHAAPMLAVWDVGAFALWLALGVTTSILTYRAFFHRLNKFPGPFAARLSNLYPTALSAKNLHLYDEVQKLHQQYGDYVRLGKHLHARRC